MVAAARGRRYVAAAVVAGLLAGCESRVAGSGSYLEGAGTVTATPEPPTPAADSPTNAPPTAPPTAPRPAPGTVPTAFSGSWRGAVAQPNSRITHWTAFLELTAGHRTGAFTIENWCSGSATVLSANPSQLVLREVIDSDPLDACATSGVVTLRRTSGVRATFRWVDDALHSNVATGVLLRG